MGKIVGEVERILVGHVLDTSQVDLHVVDIFLEVCGVGKNLWEAYVVEKILGKTALEEKTYEAEEEVHEA